MYFTRKVIESSDDVVAHKRISLNHKKPVYVLVAFSFFSTLAFSMKFALLCSKNQFIRYSFSKWGSWNFVRFLADVSGLWTWCDISASFGILSNLGGYNETIQYANYWCRIFTVNPRSAILYFIFYCTVFTLLRKPIATYQSKRTFFPSTHKNTHGANRNRNEKP